MASMEAGSWPGLAPRLSPESSIVVISHVGIPELSVGSGTDGLIGYGANNLHYFPPWGFHSVQFQLGIPSAARRKTELQTLKEWSQSSSFSIQYDQDCSCPLLPLCSLFKAVHSTRIVQYCTVLYCTHTVLQCTALTSYYTIRMFKGVLFNMLCYTVIWSYYGTII